MTLNGQTFCGTSGPDGVTSADGILLWESDGYGQRSGWRVCFPPPSPPPSPLLPPLPPPVPPLIPAVFAVSGPCVAWGYCIRSSGFPNDYGDGEDCIATNVPAISAQVTTFDVMPQDDAGACSDYMMLNGNQYCGQSGPDGVAPVDGLVIWHSDASGRRPGWE
eukprot:875267-Prymnesium_polylepis.1